MNQIRLHLNGVDYSILVAYVLFVAGVGWAIRRRVRSAADFFHSGRSLPAWICALAFVGANLGALEVIGISACGAKYGMATAHFYWIGAIPAMVFVGVFMMPFYYGSKAHSVPEYLKLRFDEKTRALNAFSFAAMTVVASGIAMCTLAKLLATVIGWNFHLCVLVSALIVLAYVFAGGLTSAIFNEVVQFFLIVFGLAPLVILGLRDVGGWQGLVDKLAVVEAANHFPKGAMAQTWTPLATTANPMGVEWFGMAMGLGFVLSFGYWCTDFLIIQSALAAKDMNAARRTPLIGAFPKMITPFLVIVPGMIAIALAYSPGSGFVLPKIEGGGYDFNLTAPAMFAYYLPNGLLGISLAALLASFMSGMSGNVTAFNTVWTYDIYRSYLRKQASDAHYLAVGRWTTVLGVLGSIGAAYAARRYDNIMDAVQLVFAFVNAPLFATFLLGMFWRRATGHAAFLGLLTGIAAAALHHALTIPAGEAVGLKGGWLGIQHLYASSMAQNFWTAIWSWGSCFTVTVLVSLVTRRNKSDSELCGLVYSLTPAPEERVARWWLNPIVLGTIVLIAALILNLCFW